MTKQVAIKVLKTKSDLKQAYDGSYYTIIGVGGSLIEWIEGYEMELEKAGIGTPRCWYQTKGEYVNDYANPSNWRDAFPADVTFLMFPLQGLHVAKLAIFKLTWGDRWFDDIVQNMR